MKHIITGLAALTLATTAAPGFAQGADEKFVSKEEFQKLQKENEQLKKDMEEMRAFKAQMLQSIQPGKAPTAVAGSPAADGPAKTGQEPDTREMARYTFPGSTKFLLTGYGAAGLNVLQHSDAAFNAQFNPILEWKISDKLFFEGELELELEDGETSTALELANLSYVANDYLTFQAGKFLNPMNSFVERYHMAWVNRLPDKPLAVYDGLLPETYLGAQVRGGLPLGPTKLNYSAFVANAPSLVTSVDDPEDAASLGTMEFDNFDNVGGRFAVGGHVGFLPIPELELGYGVHWSGVGGNDEHVLLQAVDLNYVRDSELLLGSVRFNAEWVWSHLGRGTYDNAGTPVVFRNNRDGGYAQLAYRPTKVNCDFLKHLEGVFRYDLLNQKDTPVGFDDNRYTVGLNYWLTPKTVLKVAYQIDDKSSGAGEPDQSGVLVQFATGF